jgi:carboxylesterase type B
MPFLWRNFSESDLRQWPSFDDIDRSEVKSTSDKMGKMYASFIRNGDPGASWRAFDEEDHTVLWFGKQVETRPHLLKSEWDIFTSLGPNNVAALEKILVSNVRHEFTWEGEKNHA